MNMSLLAMVEDQHVTIQQVHDTAVFFFWAAGALVSTVTLVTALLGLLTLTMVVAPGVTARSTGALREHNFVSFFAGAATFAVFGILAIIGSKVHVLGFAAVSGFTVLALVGLAAASEDVGRRLTWICGREGSRARHLAVGWLVIAAAGCVPVIGWFIVLPYAILSGLGSITVGAFSRGSAPAASREPVDLEIR